ncbi:hypothetical protein TSUD_146560 [Trifolium subterraneum]|uniref:Uncharacterized protein n=1 Tax=Trifolium subterraneum TaxID=3900 RepID=A0A2Z6M7N8_TRISU|nr:hypothetical protein TSUD_146560 [Trifolium subterraneum]
MIHNEKGSAGIEFDRVADILPSKENVCITVRVILLWKVPAFLNPSESSSLDMVLIDEKSMSNAIDLDSDGMSDDTEGGEDSHSHEFVNDLIVTPPAVGSRAEIDSDVLVAVKRSLSKVFDGVVKVQPKVGGVGCHCVNQCWLFHFLVWSRLVVLPIVVVLYMYYVT